ncbi:serine hydrolase domain-containing protein [Ruania halotolerans]|uniref:serine hydrolase domain-containing protein n=1 Tax=Ruania halotolerans TaxID=2897773 RepID=UPI001E2EE49E|nr:serine hydrolase domain-containing protein [Ruania halotolerans]UFU08111.1 beta-lactamase family protein [Ruania halotolerans]
MATPPGLDRLRTSLERLTSRRDPMPAPQVLIRTPDWEFEHGELTQRFYAASVSKVLTATLVTVLIEQGRLTFDTPVGAVLPLADIDGLPAAPGVDIAADVTVEHLLTHTSGLPDYFVTSRRHAAASSARRFTADLDRRWTLPEILASTRGLPPVAHPGERFRYSDTGYTLLGRIVEEITGSRFEQALREHVFDACAMNDTSTPHGDATMPEDLTDLEIAPIWISGQELSRSLCLSVGRADGGIVTTPADLVRFQEALHAGRLIAIEHLDHLRRPRNRLRPGIHYGAGLATIRFGGFMPPFLRGLPEPAGGIGASATHMFFYPQQRAHVVLNFHSTSAMSQSFRTHITIARLIAAPQ